MPARKHVPTDAAVLTDLYWTRNMTVAQIAQQFGCSYSTVRNRMVALNVPRRPREGFSRVTTCIVAGCDRPPHKMLHVKRGYRYGRRCRAHERVHHAARTAKHYHRIRKYQTRTGWNAAAVTALIDRAVPTKLAPDVRMEVVNELTVRFLTRAVTPAELPREAQRIRYNLLRDFLGQRLDSLDAPYCRDGAETLHDLLAAEQVPMEALLDAQP